MKNILVQQPKQVDSNKNSKKVSHRKAVAMVSKQIMATKNKTISNFYSKEMLLDMLNTPSSEGINFYFGHNDEGNNTLIAIPAEAKGVNTKVVTTDGSIKTTDKLMIGDCVSCPTD